MSVDCCSGTQRWLCSSSSSPSLHSLSSIHLARHDPAAREGFKLPRLASACVGCFRSPLCMLGSVTWEELTGSACLTHGSSRRPSLGVSVEVGRHAMGIAEIEGYRCTI